MAARTLRRVALELEIKFVAANLGRLRKRSGLTQAQLAEKANLSSRQVSIIEGGLADLSVSTLCRIAHALKVDPRELLKPAKTTKRAGRGRPPAES